jgi:hypothetical protein
VLELDDKQPIFIGFKMDGSLRRQVDALSGPNRKYVSHDDSTFLRVCRLGEDLYIGKVIHERISTSRVDDVRRNVLSILTRLFPETRMPEQLDILPCGRDEQAPPAAETEPDDADTDLE